MDIFLKEKRSHIMSKVSSTGNKTTELKLIQCFKGFKIKGWRRKYNLLGRPDFVFLRIKLAIFVDGCFWHCCPYCGTMPKTNKKFWREKFERNLKRDAFVSRKLRRLGWAVIRIRECRLRKAPEVEIKRIQRKILVATQNGNIDARNFLQQYRLHAF